MEISSGLYLSMLWPVTQRDTELHCGGLLHSKEDLIIY